MPIELNKNTFIFQRSLLRKRRSLCSRLGTTASPLKDTCETDPGFRAGASGSQNQKKKTLSYRCGEKSMMIRHRDLERENAPSFGVPRIFFPEDAVNPKP